ncbi:hypothetical protein [methane-oxidizing endosymbiont of Gigantopelta aegis]|nr:hypothetical protein [methane-oxidizing endosymbiont of Gigantopelta aegis]
MGVIARLLEQALQDTLVEEDEKTSVAIQHIIRSFDSPLCQTSCRLY